MKKKFAFILPYIGKLPDWFQLWLNSCARNPIADWLLFTDDKNSFNYPDNVIVRYSSFDELRTLFQKSFDFIISLKQPYRLCDYRPAYGEIFKDYLAGYEFWGHCDPDLIWGDLKKWLTAPSLDKYDMISHWGHCCLFRNKRSMNTLFKKRIEGVPFYRNIYSDDKKIAFDEVAGMDVFVREEGVRELILPFLDLKPAVESYGFTRTYSSYPFLFESIKRMLVRVDKSGVRAFGVNDNMQIISKEFSYVHLQKRQMSLNIDVFSDEYLIVPNTFIPCQPINVNNILSVTPNRFEDFIKRKCLALKSFF